ncbi:MAG TPA: hypothetical protein VL738_21675 [Dactylosporangium sp.]|nr:hypothetical protein [Dactylosporangium sp.]
MTDHRRSAVRRGAEVGGVRRRLDFWYRVCAGIMVASGIASLLARPVGA